ncbi:vacuolar protein sorting-associated protein 62 [Leptodontidium sp. MPI-SDFR-AT-0119]|nr:vacuolar protein sorting-associated protein 62 [Leptodontidium sp. MPI-SDFR-AT-0119]
MATQPLTRSELETAIAKYGPVLKIHPDEKYDQCSIEWFLSHCTLVDSKAPTSNIVHPTEAQLPGPPKEDKRYYFNIEDTVKSGNFETAKTYINAFWTSGMTYTDIQFWYFSAYNGHGTARFSSLIFNQVKNQGDINLAPLGEHVGDWEYAAVRVDNATKEMNGVILSAHGKNIFYDKAAVAKQFQMEDGTHPVVYSSLNGHANFPTAGPNFTEHRKVLGIPAGLEFNLLNSTADGGKRLECSKRYQVVAAKWLDGTPDAYSIPAWVAYPYRWGPEGTAIKMDSKTLGDFIKAALGKDASTLLDTPIVLLASELLHIFVKADINGAAAPATQNPWSGHY